MPGQDENLVRETYPMRAFLFICMACILIVWILVTALDSFEWTYALYTTIAVVVAYLIVMIIRAATDVSSGLRPEQGVPWDGDIGNPDEENPVARQERADQGEDVDGDGVADGGKNDGGLPPKVEE